MKCPKCHYLSFEPEPRCRNCGYDLELAAGDLALRSDEGEPAAPLDLELRSTPAEMFAPVPAEAPRPRAAEDRSATRPMRPRERRTVHDDRRAGSIAAVVTPPPANLIPEVAPSAAPPMAASMPVEASVPAPTFEPTPEPTPAPLPEPATPKPSTTTAELPLFIKAMERLTETDSDEPLVSVPAAPRPPLAVRRRAVDARPTTSPEPMTPVLPSLGEPADSPPAPPAPLIAAVEPPTRAPGQLRAEARALVRASQGKPPDGIAPGVRAAAAAIDLVIVGAIALVTIALTLRVLDRPLTDALSLPFAPLSIFLLIVAAGYLLLFTLASGQTIGKMAFGLKVVGTDSPAADRSPLEPAQAAARALATLPSVLVAGLGFLPALFGSGRALHDRLAHTRVVRT